MSCVAPFKPEPLDLDPDRLCIRLLRMLPTKSDGTIQCQIDIISLSAGQTPSYVGLSYDWGQATDPHHAIRVNGSNLTVRQNLFDFMADFVSNWPDAENSSLWVYSLCIC